MRKSLLISLLVMVLFSAKLDVSADNTYATSSSDANYNTLKSGYNNNKITKTNVTSSTTVTLYGLSECSGTSCTYHYAGNNSSFKDALSKSVVCSNGEKYISYQGTGEGGKTNYMEDNKAAHSGTVYWSEDYYVTCTSSSGDSTVQLENTVNNNTNTNTGNQYNSADPGEQKEYGVNTYFTVLGLIAIISYGFMLFAKKFNLFKNI